MPQRIVSVVPAATETLFALEVGDRLIAVGDYDRFPPEVATKERIGGLLNPNIEKIIELKPDLVISYGTQDVLRDRLQRVGIRLYPFTHGSIEHTLNYIVDLGRTVGAEHRAQEIVATIHKTFDDLQSTSLPRKPTVLIVHNRGAGLLGSFYSVGSKAFQHELIEIAGGRNVFGDVDKEVVQPTLEEVIRRAPEIVVETLSPPLLADEIEQRRRDWQAVLKSRVFILADDYMLVPGPRLDLAARKLAEIIKEN